MIDNMNTILQTPPEAFAEQIKSENMGTLSSLKNLIAMSYEQANTVVKSLQTLKNTAKNMPKEDLAKADLTIHRLYITMQQLEDRYNIINAIIGERQTL